jgi:hypothetical protein
VSPHVGMANVFSPSRNNNRVTRLLFFTSNFPPSVAQPRRELSLTTCILRNFFFTSEKTMAGGQIEASSALDYLIIAAKVCFFILLSMLDY